MRKAIPLVILAVLIIHSASRLGVLSYVFAHRYEIAYSLGLEKERTISTCNADYFQDLTLIQAQPVDDSHVPGQLFHADEIILDSPPPVLSYNPKSESMEYLHIPLIRVYPYPGSEIFHPPGFFS